MLKKVAASHAHKILSKLIDLGAVPTCEETAVVRDETHGLQVIITIAPYQGPMRISDATLEKISALQSGPAKCPLDKLTPMQQQIVALLSKDKPAKATWLAMKLGKKCGGSFRSVLSGLVQLGHAVHVKTVGYLSRT
jgi:hypothetical protein